MKSSHIVICTNFLKFYIIGKVKGSLTIWVIILDFIGEKMKYYFVFSITRFICLKIIANI